MLSPGVLTHLVREAVEGARHADGRRVREAVARLAAGADVLDLAAACRVIAADGLRALTALYGQPDTALGEAWVLDELGDAAGRPDRLFAARVITAYANCDEETVTALVAAAFMAGGAEREGSVRALVFYAAGLHARAAADGTTGEEQQHG